MPAAPLAMASEMCEPGPVDQIERSDLQIGLGREELRRLRNEALLANRAF
jgi:hypothetical protein